MMVNKENSYFARNHKIQLDHSSKTNTTRTIKTNSQAKTKNNSVYNKNKKKLTIRNTLIKNKINLAKMQAQKI